MTDAFRLLLLGGDRRSIGRADEAAARAARDPEAAEALWRLIEDSDPLVRMRAADAIEKMSRDLPRTLLPRKRDLLGGRYDDGSAEMRWHLFAICARLPLGPREARDLIARLDRAVREDRSRIVRATALQAASEVARHRPELHGAFQAMLDFALASPLPSLAARARKLAAARDRRGRA